MVQKLEIKDFLALSDEKKVLDVRTPAEFLHGHIPGAVHFPLFSDEERAEVGTLYKQVSRDAALKKGLEFVGPRLALMVDRALGIAPERDVLVHCWRGGQRSESVGWLLQTAGFQVALLEGGYKSYRRHALGLFEALPIRLLVLGGPTGSGKTELLQAMERMGAQIIDLEKLANHKGSAFGSLGEEDQPTPEHFENLLERAIRHLDPARPVWVEHESRGIGRVFLPDGFWRHMMGSPLILVDPGREARLAHAVEIYGSFDPEILKNCFARITSRMGGQHVKAAMEAIDAGDIETAASLALVYYDKAYALHLEKYPHAKIHWLSNAGMDTEATARQLLEQEKPFLS